MSPSRVRSLVPVAFLAAAVVFGMMLAGGLQWSAATPAEAASPAPVAQSSTPPAAPPAAGGYPSFADLAERVLPGVVSIDATTIEKAGTGRERRSPHGGGNGGNGGGEGSPFEFFFGPQGRDGEPGRERRSDAGGSGFIVSPDGFVVTNNHVIEGATKVRVRLDGRDYPAEIKGADPATDLAVLKIDAGHDLPYLRLGDSERLRVGDYVMAVGNPLNLDHTVTVGVVSAKHRTIGLNDTSFENFIQTDAAINRGNSGGPLVNLAGEVIGIATAMNWGAENIGFAVPVNTLKTVYDQLRDKGKVQRGYLGVKIQSLDYERAQAFGLDRPDGALVTSVDDGTPAAKAGMQHGDVIVAVDGRSVKESRDLIDYVSSVGPDKTVKLDVLRNGKRVDVPVKLGQRPSGEAEPETVSNGEATGIDWLGIDVEDVNAGSRQNFGLPGRLDGAVVTDVKPSSPLYDQGVGPGDVITEVNGKTIASAKEFEAAIKKLRPSEYARLYLVRGSGRRGGGNGSPVQFFAIVQAP